MKSSLRKIEGLMDSYEWIVEDIDDWMEGTTSATLGLLVSGEVVCSKSFPSNDQESRHAIRLTLREAYRLTSLLSGTDEHPQVFLSESLGSTLMVTQRCLVQNTVDDSSLILENS